jgi:ABC-type lipoprotein release transport system permease subunit
VPSAGLRTYGELVDRARSGPALRVWFGSEVRRRWASLLLLGVMAGLAVGLVTAAVSGAQRSTSAYTRMRQQLKAADAVFFPSQIGIGEADVTKLGSIPEVAAWSGFALGPGSFSELGPDAGPFTTVGHGWWNTIERAKVLAGRLPDPTRDDEMVVNEPAVKLGARVGKTLTFHGYTPADFAATEDGAKVLPDDQLHGPVVTMKIVGVIRMPLDSVLTFATEPELYPSPGFYAQHRDQMAFYFTNGLVRLRHGAADLPAFQAHLAQVYGRADIPVKDLSDDVKRVQNSTDLERTALLLFAAAAALASIVLIGQAFVRSTQAESDAVPILSAMGLDPPALATGLALPHVLAVATAIVSAVVTTYVLSARFPIGLARQLDPDLGYHLRPGYLLAAVVVALVVTTGMAVGSSLLTTRAALSRSRVRRTRVVGAASRAGASVPVAVGASLALEQAGGRRGAVPVRSALAAATAAVLGVVAATTLVSGIDDALHDPARSGRTWKLEAEPSVDLVLHPPAVAGLADMALVSRFAATVNGKDVPFYALDQVKGALRFVVLRGRQPVGDDETMIGARSAKVLHVGIGDTIRSDSGGPTLRIVGIGLMTRTPHSTFDEGALMSMKTVDAASGMTFDQREGALLFSPAPGTKVSTLQAELAKVGIEASPPEPVADVTNLGQVRSLPYLLAGFLIVLGLGAVAHALLTVSRRRAKELAVLRAVGLSPRQAAACVGWQAVVVAAIALLIGIPVGLAIGREAWRRVANSIPLVYVGPTSPRVLALIVPAALAALLALAAAPAWQAAHLRTAATLRAE